LALRLLFGSFSPRKYSRRPQLRRPSPARTPFSDTACLSLSAVFFFEAFDCLISPRPIIMTSLIPPHWPLRTLLNGPCLSFVMLPYFSPSLLLFLCRFFCCFLVSLMTSFPPCTMLRPPPLCLGAFRCFSVFIPDFQPDLQLVLSHASYSLAYSCTPIPPSTRHSTPLSSLLSVAILLVRTFSPTSPDSRTCRPTSRMSVPSIFFRMTTRQIRRLGSP